MAASTTWSVISGGRPVGEFPEQYLVKLAAEGRVNPNDLYFRPGMTQAAPVYTIPVFERYFRTPTAGDDPALRWVLPVGRSGWAIAAGYLALFSLLLVFGPFALLTGILGVRAIQRNPRLHGMGRAIFGIVTGSVASLILLYLVVRNF